MLSGNRIAFRMRRGSAQRRRRVFLDAACYILLGAGSVFALLPLVWGLSTSLKPESMVLSADPQWIPSTVTLENFRLALFESEIPRALLNSVIVTITAVVLTIAVAIPAGYAAARYRFRGRSTLLFYVLATSMIPGIAVLLPLYVIAVGLGLTNNLLTMIVIYAAWQVPTVTWIVKGFFEAVPKEIEDAARVDGCSSIRILLQIMVPIIQPGLAAAAVIAFVYIWNDFLIGATFATETHLRLINVSLYQYLSQYGIVWGQLMAAVMVTLLPVALFFALLEPRFIEGLSRGAIKG